MVLAAGRTENHPQNRLEGKLTSGPGAEMKDLSKSQALIVLLDIYRERLDLQYVFPEVLDGNMGRLIEWASSAGTTIDSAREYILPHKNEIDQLVSSQEMASEMLRSLPACMNKGAKWLQGVGIEIGAHNLPIEDISPIYIDRFSEFAGTKCVVDVISDASLLPFRENSLDYIASSHLFEHLPNPIITFCGWYRCLKAEGVIYMVVPDRRFTFDHGRKRTALSHLISDFENNTTNCDATHIDDFINNGDLSILKPDLAVSDFPKFREEHRIGYYNAVNAGREINIHFHVFEKEDILELINFMTTFKKTKLNWNIVEVQERYPSERKDGFLVVIKKSTN
jgi:SAM-dependent methyltransferase